MCAKAGFPRTAYSCGQINCALPFSEISPRRALGEVGESRGLHRTAERHRKPPSAYQLCLGALLIFMERAKMHQMALHGLTYCTSHISRTTCSFCWKLRIWGLLLPATEKFRTSCLVTCTKNISPRSKYEVSQNTWICSIPPLLL